MHEPDAMNDDKGEGKIVPAVDVKKIKIRQLLLSSGQLSFESVVFLLGLLLVLLTIVYSAGKSARVTAGTEVSQSDRPLASDDSVRGAEEFSEGIDALFQEDIHDLLIEKEEILRLQADLVSGYQRLSEEPTTTDYYRSLYSQRADSLARAFGIGGPYQLPIEINLHKGWNIVGYSGPQQISPREAFAGIMPILKIVKNESGGIFIPSHGIDQIEALVPGRGYQVFVQRDTVFAFPG